MSEERYLESWTGLTVVVVGEAMLDRYIGGSSRRLCQEAPVPVVDVAMCQELPGGAANTAANVACLGAKAILLSVVGDDWEGTRLKQVLQEQGVVTKHVLTSSLRRTIAKQRVVTDSQAVVRFDWGSTDAVDKEAETAIVEQLTFLFAHCNAVIVSDYGYGMLTPKVIEFLAQLQAAQPRLLTVDSKRLQVYRELGATAVKPNYQEAVQLLDLPGLTGTARVEQIAASGEQLLALTGAQLVAVTLDTEGAVILERDRAPYHLPTIPASHLQAIGAGDTFISALTLALAVGAPTQTAALLATTATQAVITQPGTSTCSAFQLRRQLTGNPKLVERSELVALAEQHRSAGQRIVFTNGCFDILHVGHVTYLQQAKALGDILIIGVNSDESVKRLKGDSRPINPLGDRLTVLAALESVNYVVPFAESTPSELIKLVRPDIFVKGGDYTPQTLPEAPLVKELGGSVRILPFVQDRSTTSMINRIRQV